MTLALLPKARCGPAKARRYPIDVSGTANISLGHKLRDSAKTHGPRRSIFDGTEERPEDKREYEQFLKTLDFEKETNRKIRNKNLRQRVQQGVQAYEESLEARREKLRDLVLNEETDLTREIVEEVQRADETRVEEMRARAEELRKRHCEEHEALVTAKRMQQYLASCPDVKRELSKRSAIDAKRCNAAQVADNEARRRAEKELDALWHEVMLKEFEAKRRIEAEQSERRISSRQEAASTLAKQVADKLTLEEERKQVEKKDERERLEKLWEEVRCAELRNLETERRKREKCKKELEEQLLTGKRLLAERAREEAAEDRAYKTLAAEELAEEKARMEESAVALRAELVAYLKYLEDLRQEETRRNFEVEAIIRESNKDAETRRELAVKKFKEARQRALREVLRGREEQLRERREAEENERRLKMEEREELERQIEMDANLTAMKREENREKAFRYGRYLKVQQERVEMTRRRELEEERRFYRVEAMRQADEYQKLTDELLNASENITPHPFKVLLKDRAAQSEGCLPALTSGLNSQ